MKKNELRSIMVKYGDTNMSLAESLGITPQAVSCKLNEKRGFSVKQIQVIAERYQLDPEDIQRIFFAS